jgi:hypothetical protein
MNKTDNPYNLFPTDEYVVKMIHLHPSNSTSQQRGKSAYRSILKVWKKLNVNFPPRTDVPPDIQVEARCRPGDAPSRAKAREILRIKAQAVKEALQW